MNERYPRLALIGCFLIQLPFWYREYFKPEIKDRTYSVFYHWQSVAFVAIALLLIAPVLRHGDIWQRILEILRRVLPVAELVGYFKFALALRASMVQS